MIRKRLDIIGESSRRNSMYRKIILYISIMLLMLSVTGCTAPRITDQEVYSLTTEVTAIDLSGYNGEIRWVSIRNSEQPRIVVEKEVRGSSSQAMKNYLETLRIEDYSTASEVVLRAVQPRRPWGVSSSAIRFTVYASPDQIERFQAQTSNGPIRVETDFWGTLDLRTSNGPIILRSGEGVVNLSTSNGRIELGRVNLIDSSTVRTSNGRIEGMVRVSSIGDYLFETSNGQINLRMPRDTAGTFDITTSNGYIRFHLGPDKKEGRNSVYIRRGHQPSIRIKTSNGDVTVTEGYIY